MSNTAFYSLPKEWQDWLNENLERGCDPAEMTNLMVTNGHYNVAFAMSIIQDLLDLKNSSDGNTFNLLPFVDTSSNQIKTPDRIVDVLMSINSPRIVLLGNVLSDAECDLIASLGDQRMERSVVVDSDNGSAQVNPDRTSSGAMFVRGENEFITTIEERLAAIANWPVENGEGLQVLRYDVGNEYRPHHDWFDANNTGTKKHLEHGGQRLGTFVLYLNDVESGGSTSFPSIGLEVLPKKGNAVFFVNTDINLTPDQQTLHAGTPVLKGVKFAANKWLRESKY